MSGSGFKRTTFALVITDKMKCHVFDTASHVLIIGMSVSGIIRPLQNLHIPGQRSVFQLHITTILYTCPETRFSTSNHWVFYTCLDNRVATYVIFWSDISMKLCQQSMLAQVLSGHVQHDDVMKWKTFLAVLVLCAGNSPVTGEFPTQRPVTRSFDVSLICAWINGLINNREFGDFLDAIVLIMTSLLRYEIVVQSSAVGCKGDSGTWDMCRDSLVSKLVC